MIAEAGAAFSGIKTAMDIANGISSLKNEVERNQAVIDIQRALLEVLQIAHNDANRIANLNIEINSLKSEIQSRDEWEKERSRYKLTQSQIGAYTYDLRVECADGEIIHRICATCFSNGKKSILHTTAKHSGGEIVECLACASKLTLSDFQYEIRSVPRDDWGRGGY